MSNLKTQIAELEAKAADSELIANLAADRNAQRRHAELARRIKQQVDNLRAMERAMESAA